MKHYKSKPNANLSRRAKRATVTINDNGKYLARQYDDRDRVIAQDVGKVDDTVKMIIDADYTAVKPKRKPTSKSATKAKTACRQTPKPKTTPKSKPTAAKASAPIKRAAGSEPSAKPKTTIKTAVKRPTSSTAQHTPAQRKPTPQVVRVPRNASRATARER